jgi:hypothetical protein
MKYLLNKKRASSLSIKSIAIIFSRENSKLCFELLVILSAAQNHLPCRGLENTSEVGVY